jgi:hypothetical protein
MQEVGGTGTDSLAGIGTDAAGNVYLAGSTLSTNFPVKSAVQNQLSSVGIYRIDVPGSAYTPLGLSSASLIAVDPLNPSVLMAASGGAGMKSTDGGNTWTALPIPSSTVQVMAIDAVNDQNIYAGATGQSILKSTGPDEFQTSSAGRPDFTNRRREQPERTLHLGHAIGSEDRVLSHPPVVRRV